MSYMCRCVHVAHYQEPMDTPIHLYPSVSASISKGLGDSTAAVLSFGLSG